MGCTNRATGPVGRSFALGLLLPVLLSARSLPKHRAPMDKESALDKRKGHNEDLVGSSPVAIAITVTKDPNFDKIPSDKNQLPAGFADGAAILAESVKDTMSKEYPVDMIALVNPQVQALRKPLEKFGFRVIEYEFPLKSSDIQGEELRKTIDKSGCCGMSEFGKLGAWKLTQYKKVLVMDSDTLLLQNIDELWAADFEAQYTYDHGLAGGCINGGFVMLKPSLEVHDELVEMVRVGDFKPGSAWGGKHIGWCYGGQTYQGLIPYYYQESGKRSKESWTAVDSCIYNNMVASKNDEGRVQEKVPIEEIKTTHFTVCQKPWSCYGSGRGLCKLLHDQWWVIRGRYEEKHGLKQGARCKHGEYEPIDHAGMSHVV